MNKAMAFKINTVPIAMLISSDLALITGATAAMALPPQIAVPEAINLAKPGGNLKNLFRMYTKKKTIAMVDIVNPKPALLTSIALSSCKPKPNPMIDHCNTFLDPILLNSSKGFPKTKVKPKPKSKAIGALTHGVKVIIANKTNNILASIKLSD